MAKKWFDSNLYLGNKEKILRNIVSCERKWEYSDIPVSFEGPSGVHLYRVFLQDLRVGNVYFAYRISSLAPRYSEYYKDTERVCFQFHHVSLGRTSFSCFEFVGYEVEKVYNDDGSEFTYERAVTRSYINPYDEPLDAQYYVFYSETDNFHKEAMKAERLATGITEGIKANRGHPKYLRRQVDWGFEDPFEGMDEPDEISSIEEI